MRLFISYSHLDRDKVKQFVSTLEHHDIWIDAELHGGQRWWDEILKQIQCCDVFVYCMTDNSARSESCKQEYAYAQALNRNILPVILQDDLNFGQINHHIQQIEAVSYDNLEKIIKSLDNLPAGLPLPSPLPPSPPTPIKTPHFEHLDIRPEVISFSKYKPTSPIEIIVVNRSNLPRFCVGIEVGVEPSILELEVIEVTDQSIRSSDYLKNKTITMHTTLQAILQREDGMLVRYMQIYGIDANDFRSFRVSTKRPLGKKGALKLHIIHDQDYAPPLSKWSEESKNIVGQYLTHPEGYTLVKFIPTLVISAEKQSVPDIEGWQLFNFSVEEFEAEQYRITVIAKPFNKQNDGFAVVELTVKKNVWQNKMQAVLEQIRRKLEDLAEENK